tara:strand:+ start:1861 stop:2061 length:201 start_codon:yes stop_codon:yes gene_type:complete
MAKYKRDLSKPLASTYGDPPFTSKTKKPKTKFIGPKMEPGKKPFTKNGITYTWDRKHSTWRGNLKP